MDLGSQLRQVRQQRNLSLYDVEQRTGLHFSTIAKYERGERRPGLDALRELAEVYGVSLGELIGEAGPTAASPDPELRPTARLLAERHDLQSLVGICGSLHPDQVLALVGFLRTVAPNPAAPDAPGSSSSRP